MKEKIEAIKQNALKALKEAVSKDDIENLRVKFLGKKGELELCELEPPVCGSVEQVIDETSDTIAFLPTKGFDGYCYMRYVGSLGSRHQFLSYSVGHATDGILLFKKSAPMVKIETRCDPSHYSIYEYLERSKMQREYLQKMKLDM